jgi:RNA polymerase sigma-70 factor (ECF subfamily)
MEERHNIQQEKILIERSQSGNAEAFGSLYDLYINEIYKYIAYRVRHKETAEDITSKVFLKVLDSIQKVDSSRPFGAWMYRVARNAVIDYFRSNRQHEDIDGMYDLSSKEETAEEKTNILLDSERVQSLLKELTPIQQEVIELRVWQELSYKEIAEIVGKSEDNCKMIFSRAMVSLRKLMPAIVSLIFLIRQSL